MTENENIHKGAVLSDEDIKEEMKKYPDVYTQPLVADEEGKPLDLEEKDEELLQPSCVDLRVGRIYVPGKEQCIIKKEDGKYLMEPGAMVHIESKERISTPQSIMGFLIPKNSKSEAGLLMLNAGHVDPGWRSGFMTAEIMNNRADPFEIRIGEPLFSVVFVYVHTPTTRWKEKHDKERRERAALMLLGRPPISLQQYYTNELYAKLRREFASSDEVRAAGMRTLTIVIVIFGSMAALATGILIAFALWQSMN